MQTHHIYSDQWRCKQKHKKDTITGAREERSGRAVISGVTVTQPLLFATVTGLKREVTRHVASRLLIIDQNS